MSVAGHSASGGRLSYEEPRSWLPGTCDFVHRVAAVGTSTVGRNSDMFPGHRMRQRGAHARPGPGHGQT